MKTALRRASILTTLAALASVAPACGGSDDSALFTGGDGGASATGGGGTGTGGTGTGGTGTGGTGTGGAAGTGTGGAGTGGAAGSGTGGAAGTAGAGGEPGWTLDNVCNKLPTLICADREQCCSKAFGFDKAACEAKEKADCDADVQRVTSNQATFHPDRIDPCLKAVQPLLGACFFQGDLYTSLLKTANLCRGIFEGNKAPGTSCSNDNECQTAPLPNGYSGCGSQSKQCYQATIKQQGEAVQQRDAVRARLGLQVQRRGQHLPAGQSAGQPAAPRAHNAHSATTATSGSARPPRPPAPAATSSTASPSPARTTNARSSAPTWIRRPAGK